MTQTQNNAIPSAVEQVYARLLEDSDNAAIPTLRDTGAESSADASMAAGAPKLEKPRYVSGSEAARHVNVRSLILHDDIGKMQALLPTHSLIDLEDLNRQLDREFRPLAPKHLTMLEARHGWATIPALPAVTGLASIVERGLLAEPTVIISGEKRGSFIVLGQAFFGRLNTRSEVVQACIPLERLKVNRTAPEHDIDQITHAIQSLTSLRIEKRLRDTLELPPLPQTANSIIQLRVNANAGINDLSEIIDTDPALAAQVVSWACSSFYAAPGRISSVHDAIMRVLGFDLVMNLAIGLSLGNVLRMPRNVPEAFTPYWEQAVWMATLSGALADAMPKNLRPDRGRCYLAGLLHNIGYLVLAHVFPPHFDHVNRTCEANLHLDSEFCEQHILGITREQIGSRLMDIWNMPAEVVDAIRHQKNPDHDGEYATYSKVMFLATQLLRQRNIGQGPAVEISDEMFEALGLTRETADIVAETLFDMSDEIQSLAVQLTPAV